MPNKRCCCDQDQDDCTDYPISCAWCDDAGVVDNQITVDFTDFDLEVYTAELLNFLPPKEHVDLTGQSFVLDAGGEFNQFGCCRYLYVEESEECDSPLGPIKSWFRLVAEYDWRDEFGNPGVKLYEGLFLKVSWHGFSPFDGPGFPTCPDPVLGKFNAGGFTLHAREKEDNCSSLTGMLFNKYDNYGGFRWPIIDDFTVNVSY